MYIKDIFKKAVYPSSIVKDDDDKYLGEGGEEKVMTMNESCR